MTFLCGGGYVLSKSDTFAFSCAIRLSAVLLSLSFKQCQLECPAYLEVFISLKKETLTSTGMENFGHFA